MYGLDGAGHAPFLYIPSTTVLGDIVVFAPYIFLPCPPHLHFLGHFLLLTLSTRFHLLAIIWFYTL